MSGAGSRVRAALRAVPGILWVAALLVVVAVVAADRWAAIVALACAALGVLQLGRAPGRSQVATGGAGGADPAGLAVVEVLFALVVGSAVVSGALGGWLLAGTPWAALGGALVLGIVGFVVASLLVLALAGLVRALGRRWADALVAARRPRWVGART